MPPRVVPCVVARPMSPILMRPRESRNKFTGLRSRWIMPCAAKRKKRYTTQYLRITWVRMCTRPSTISLKSLQICSLSLCKPSSIRFLKVLISQYSIWMYNYDSSKCSALDSLPVSCHSTLSSESSDLKKEKIIINKAGICLFPKHPVTLWSRASANVFCTYNNYQNVSCNGHI